MINVNRILAKTLKLLWATAAGLLVTVAVAISVLRYTLPYMDKQKGLLEEWVSAQYGVEVNIGEISASWEGIGPAILLRDISLAQSQDAPLGLHVSETSIEVDFWGSILARQLQSRHFSLDGLDLQLDLTRLGASDSNYPIVDALQNLFLNQLHAFSVENSSLTLLTAQDSRRIQIRQLDWQNRGERHQGIGQLRVAELANNATYFALELKGEQDNLDGMLYVNAEDLDLSPWLNHFIDTDQQIDESRGNFAAWAAIDNSQFTSIQLTFGHSALSWSTPQKQTSAELLDGEIVAVPDKKGWLINANQLRLMSDGKLLTTDWNGRFESKGNWRLASRQNFLLDPLTPLLSLFMVDETAETIQAVNPKGQLDQLTLGMVNGQFEMHAGMSGLSWQASKFLPGVTGLSADLNWFAGRGSLHLKVSDAELDTDILLGRKLAVAKLDSWLYLEPDAESYRLVIPKLSLESPDISLNQQLAYDFSSGELAIGGSLAPMDTLRAKSFFPTSLMGKQVVGYLDGALQQGQIREANYMWHGKPADFPYANHNGIFQAGIELQQQDFRFDAGWPAIRDANLSLLFENQGLTIRSTQGVLDQVAIGDIVANIPALTSGAHLSIDASGSATGPQVTQLMLNSTLSDSVGAVLENLQVQGPVSASLKLDIPLAGGHVVAKGQVQLPGNHVLVAPLDMALQQTQGQLSFENDKVTVSRMQANLFGQPVSFSVDGASLSQTHGYRTEVGIDADWDVTPLLQKYRPGLAPFLSGKGHWHSDLTLTNGADGEFNYQMALDSEMLNVASSLPAPFDKSSDSVKPFIANVEGNNQASTIQLTFGDDIKFSGILPHKEKQFSRAHLALGKTDMVGLGYGFSISADLPSVDFNAWYRAIEGLLVNPEIQGEQFAATPILDAPTRIFAETGTLLIAGQQLQNVDLLAKQSGLNWNLQINSEEARLDMLLNHDWQGRGIEVNADYINLAEWKQGEEKLDEQDYTNLPPIKFSCLRCAIKGINLGKLDLQLSPNDKGMAIDTVSLLNKNGTLTGSGQWLINEKQNRTEINGALKSSDIGAFLRDFDVKSGIKDSEAKIDYTLSWNDTPFKLDTHSLNGKLEGKLSDGYLTEVSDKGSRIFSILSLESLVRKLSLDFRDVFAKGFFYDKIESTFDIKNGVIHTDDLLVDGGAGDISVKGATNLNDQTLDYRIQFTPNVTSSLPVIVAWMVNPATAIAALALDEVLTSAKVISNIQYSLTGTIDTPVLTEIERGSKEIALPAQQKVPTQPAIDDNEQPQSPSANPAAAQPSGTTMNTREEVGHG